MTIKGNYAYLADTWLYFQDQPQMSDQYPLLLIHGHTLDQRMWQSQMAALTPHLRVIRPDLRGYGHSDSPDIAIPFRYALDLDGLLNLLDVSKAHVMGLSLGGNIALEFALNFPQRVNRLILVSSSLSGFPPLPGVAQSLQAIFERAKEAGIEAARQLWLEHPLFEAARENPEVSQQLSTIVKDYSGWHWANEYSPSRAIDPTVIEHLEQIQAPTLVVVGERDTPQNRLIADLLSERIPKARKVIMEGVGHMVNLEAPEIFNRLVLEELQRTSPAQRIR